MYYNTKASGARIRELRLPCVGWGTTQRIHVVLSNIR